MERGCLAATTLQRLQEGDRCSLSDDLQLVVVRMQGCTVSGQLDSLVELQEILPGRTFQVQRVKGCASVLEGKNLEQL